MASPFVNEPLNQTFAQENSMAEIVWTIESCGWDVTIRTKNDTLYPNLTSPIHYTNYNVTEKCKDHNVNTTVVLSIVFSKDVLKIAHHVICKVSKNFNGTKKRYNSRVNLIIAAPSPATTMNSNSLTTTFTPNSTSTTLIEMTTDAGCRLCVHFSGLILCLFVAMFAFSWTSWH